MARPKNIQKIEKDSEVVPTTIDKLSIDYGREDINNIAKKVNEIIDRLNA